MAVWQVEFAIVPRRILTAKPRVALPRVMDTDWWSAERLPAGYAQHLDAVALPGSPSGAELQSWGVEDGNRVDVCNCLVELHDARPPRLLWVSRSSLERFYK